ncbi:cdp-alcohol phosphatidyltransferase [Ophiostoma piceae UAMH 11346]|uniref:diacylglycerol cholinephosphotransferase n=1 Tax=Ophiostoma piceae (strain UAMH 11346) TaxID=1262450 RepID=S3BYU3_OPHP1|nr:cdp-alcohol phosphatidyltransferase [Ophiostoma piceae UAMH 11346]
MVYLRQESLKGLKLYKYSGIDHSLTSKYILKPFYNNIVLPCFPVGMAPNLITLSGFTFVIANLLTLLWYNPTLDQDCPPWVYYSWAVGLFLYQTFDAVDGAQAPLGEMFDHGVDALNTSLEVLLFAGSQNMGQGWQTIALLFASLCTFYIQTWEEYHTHTLKLGVISGPVEGILIIITVYILTGYLGGASFWKQPMLSTLGVSANVIGLLPPLLRDLSFTEWWLAQGSAVVGFNMIEATRTVMRVYNKKQNEMTKEERASDRNNNHHPLLGLVPFFATWALVVSYLLLQPEILTAHIVPFVFFVGLFNAYSVGQMITAHVAHLPFPYYNVMTIPLAFGVIDSLGPRLQTLEPAAASLLFGTNAPPAYFRLGWPSALGDGVYQVAYMFLMLGTAIGVYGSFVVDVIVTICDYLDIWCLTIKYPYVEGAPEKKKESEPAAIANSNAAATSTSIPSTDSTATQRRK